MDDGDDVDRKRPRIEYEEDAAKYLESKSYLNHPTLYHDDGNIILKCKSSTTLFRVHKSILVKKSVVFYEIFAREFATQPPKNFRDCYLVEVDDDKDDLASLLTAIYDGFDVSDHAELTVENFPAFAGFLRIATKYKIERVKQLLMDRLYTEWPSELDKHDAKRSAFAARYLRRVGQQADDVIVHPASVIALVRDCDPTAVDLLAPLFYDLSTRMWQFAGEAAGHHLAPLTMQEIERFIVGIAKLRTSHTKLSEAPTEIPRHPNCKASLLDEWARRSNLTLHRSNNYMCTPIEDWGTFLADLKARRWLCAECHLLLLAYCEQSRKSLWESIFQIFNI